MNAKALVAALRKKHGAEAALLMGESVGTIHGVCPTGSTVLDRWVLEIGGIPYGKVIEIYGNEGAGKTTLMNSILAGCQKDGSIAALAETEYKWDPAWAKLLGVNLDELMMLQPPHLESFHEQVETIIARAQGTPVVIALDSVAMTKCKSEVEEGITGDAAIAEAARIWSRGLRILVESMSKKQVTLILLNPIRSKIGVMYGNPETTPGGNAIKSQSIIRLSVSHGKLDQAGGRYMNVTAFKNQVCPPFRHATLRLNFAKGFNDRWSIINHAKEMKIVDPKCQSLKEALEGLHWEGVNHEGTDEEAD